MRRERRQIAQINVVPYIDVMLVLLVIFMITAPFISPGQVNLPSVAKTQPASDLPLEILIRSDGGILLKDRAKDGEGIAISRDRIGAIVARRLAVNPDRPVVIAADKDVRYENVMDVMSALQRGNVKRIGLLAKPQP